MSKKNQAEGAKIELSQWREFEVDAYRIESQLAAERNSAESRLRALENSRTWRWTAPLRRSIGFVVRPIIRNRIGLKLLRWLDSKI